MNVRMKDFKYEKMRKEQIKEFKNLLFQAMGTDTLSMFCENNKIDYFQLTDFLNMKIDKIPMKILKTIAYNIDSKNYNVVLQKILDTIGMRMQIWYVDLGSDTIGHEQRGVRPVIIIGSQEGSIFSGVVTVAMITGAEHNKSIMSTHVILDTDAGLKKRSIASLEQQRTIDKSRLKSYVGTVTKREDIIKINTAINKANGTYNEYDEIHEMIEIAELKQEKSILNDISIFKNMTKAFKNSYREKVVMGA